MHPSALAWASTALDAGEVTGQRVLEVGSCDVNGSARPAIEALRPAGYVGTDMAAGPRVDRVVPADRLADEFGPDAFGVVVSTEMLEHAQDWQACLRAMIGVLAPGGLLVITTRSPGFPYHGYPEDHWRYPPAVFGQIIKAAGLDVLALLPDPDPASPGVFCKARKPPGWSWPAAAGAEWAAAEVTRP